MSKFQNTGEARATSIVVKRYVGDVITYQKEYTLELISEAPVEDVPLMSEEEYSNLIGALIEYVTAQEPGIEINVADSVKTDLTTCPI